ncbi:hypothetical protein Q5P01_010210 [Channa striata]|uniref:Uncharacterized protein n=1 Tax=Channa striata TaxID=64152 RepID=A0AA88SVE0_CHASR|nr:hypothetical protein Q5P01_010210 [Channa striata]
MRLSVSCDTNWQRFHNPIDVTLKASEIKCFDKYSRVLYSGQSRSEREELVQMSDTRKVAEDKERQQKSVEKSAAVKRINRASWSRRNAPTNPPSRANRLRARDAM